MKRIMLLMGFVLLLFTMGQASAVPLHDFFEMDLDNWTRLYDNGSPVEIGVSPALGYESRAFITLNDLSDTNGAGGPDGPAYWVGGTTDGTYLHGFEQNVKITEIYAQDDGTMNIYFDHMTDDPTHSDYWEVEVYQTGITWADFVKYGDSTDPGDYLGLGPAAFDTIVSSLSADPSSNLILQGRFATSTYFETEKGLAGENIDAVVAINIPMGLRGGEWINQITTPFGLGVNAFVDINPLVGQGSEIDGGAYGFSPDGTEEYDLAIQNVRLLSENSQNVNDDVIDGGYWIVSDDGIRGNSTIPEPNTMILLGFGLLGLAGISRKKFN